MLLEINSLPLSMKKVITKLLENEREPLLEQNKRQQRQLQKILLHAKNHSPFYQRHFKSIEFPDLITLKTLTSLPTLSRRALQQNFNDIMITKEESALSSSPLMQFSSGTTGQPIAVLNTEFMRLHYDAAMLKEHLWHKRDIGMKLMSIRWLKKGVAMAPLGIRQKGWGPPISNYLANSGEALLINIASETKKQIAAIQSFKPQIIASYPSQLLALAKYAKARKLTLPKVTEIRTSGEQLFPHQLEIIKEQFHNPKVSDIYCSGEVGMIAATCPEKGAYHLNMENVILELINENGHPCRPGETGKVLLTHLLNFATPLIRYELGDYASFSSPCECGRQGLVLEKILGRTRHRLCYPNGKKAFPYLGEFEEYSKATDINSISQFQFIQHSLEEIEIKLVTLKALESQQEKAFKSLLRTTFGYPFQFSISYHDYIYPNANGKFEEFVSKCS